MLRHFVSVLFDSIELPAYTGKLNPQRVERPVHFQNGVLGQVIRLYIGGEFVRLVLFLLVFLFTGFELGFLFR